MPQAGLNASSLRHEMIIEGVLTHVTDRSAAQEISPLAKPHDGNPPIVAFGTAQPGGGMAYGPEPTPASRRQIRITIDGGARYFTQVAAENGADNATGFHASAWVETDQGGAIMRQADGRFDVRLCYPGYKKSLAETGSMFRTRLGGMNPQVYAVKEFVDRVLETVGERNIAAINLGGHSMGASNALASHFYLQRLGVASTAILIEPWGAGLAVDWLKKQLTDPASDLAQSFLSGERMTGEEVEALLTRNAVSIRSVVEAGGGFKPAAGTFVSALLHPGFKPRNNRAVGEEMLVDMTGSDNIAPVWFNPRHRLVNIIHQLATRDADALIHVGDAVPAGPGWVAEPFVPQLLARSPA